MGQVRTLLVCLASVVVLTSSGFAQAIVDDPVLPSTSISFEIVPLRVSPELSAPLGEERAAELTAWMEDYDAWRKWFAQWANRREPGWFSSYRERRQQPQPPEWLPDRCEMALVDAELVTRACALLAESRNFTIADLNRPAVVPSAKKEDKGRATWWEYIHVDAIWPTMQWQSSTYGVVGTHLATTIRGRWQIFLAPGAMLVNLGTPDGGRTWKLATNYGVGYHLFDFPFLGGQPASFHVNLAKAWLLADVTDVVTGRTVDFIGFSISFKRR
jgi:hypothetical protein